METLKELDYRPFFGFGQVQFRPKVRGEKPPTKEKLPGVAMAPEGGKTNLPTTSAKQPRQSKTKGKRKSFPNKPSLKKSGKKPPSKEKDKTDSPRPPPPPKQT